MNRPPRMRSMRPLRLIGPPGWWLLCAMGSVSLPLLGLVAGCITVNINFPDAEIENAADQIVGEARELGDAATPPSAKSDANETSGAARGAVNGAVNTSTDGAPSGFHPRSGLLVAFVIGDARRGPEGVADDEKKKKKKKEIEIDIDDPIITTIRASLKKRYEDLLPFYKKSALGESLEGLIVAREEGVKLTLQEKRQLRQLVAAENKDRTNLYRRIVEVNDIDPDDITRVQKIFGVRWIAACEKGWWVQEEKGKWIRKPKGPEKKDGKSLRA